MIIDTFFKWRQPRGLALLVAFAIVACETTTSETRTDPIVTHTKSAADSFERRAVRIVGMEAAGPKSVRVRTTTSFACSLRFIDTKSTTITRTTAVPDPVQKNVQNAALVGGGLICAGLLCGGAIAPFVSFDPKQKDNDGRYVPVGEQAAFAWWPVGAAIAGGGVALGAPFAAAMPIASLHEHVEREDYSFDDHRAERDFACDKEEPTAGILLGRPRSVDHDSDAAGRLADSGPSLMKNDLAEDVIGKTDSDGAIIIDIDSAVEAALQSGTAVVHLRCPEPSCNGDTFEVLASLDDGFVRKIHARHSTGGVDFDLAAFPWIVAMNSQRQQELDANRAEVETQVAVLDECRKITDPPDPDQSLLLSNKLREAAQKLVAIPGSIRDRLLVAERAKLSLAACQEHLDNLRVQKTVHQIDTACQKLTFHHFLMHIEKNGEYARPFDTTTNFRDSVDIVHYLADYLPQIESSPVGKNPRVVACRERIAAMEIAVENYTRNILLLHQCNSIKDGESAFSVTNSPLFMVDAALGKALNVRTDPSFGTERSLLGDFGLSYQQLRRSMPNFAEMWDTGSKVPLTAARKATQNPLVGVNPVLWRELLGGQSVAAAATGCIRNIATYKTQIQAKMRTFFSDRDKLFLQLQNLDEEIRENDICSSACGRSNTDCQNHCGRGRVDCSQCRRDYSKCKNTCSRRSTWP